MGLKRYRYTGMEKDEETGLSYHGARYYASWLGRWTAADPIGINDGYNLFQYSKNSPVKLSDQNGKHVTNNFIGKGGGKREFMEFMKNTDP